MKCVWGSVILGENDYKGWVGTINLENKLCSGDRIKIT